MSRCLTRFNRGQSGLENVVQRQLETNLESQAAPLVGGAKAAASIMNGASLDLNNEIFSEIGEIDEFERSNSRLYV